MGNVLAQPQKLQPDIAADLPNVVQKDTLGEQGFVGDQSSEKCAIVLAAYLVNVRFRWWSFSEDSTVRA